MNPPCALDAVERTEPLLGSAAVGRRFVLIGWPKGQWGPKPMKSELFAPLQAWASALDAKLGGKTVVRLFADPADDGVEARLFPLGRRVRADGLEALPSALDAALAEPEAFPAAPRTLAVCTHGKHDACCAREGQGVYRALSTALSEARPPPATNPALEVVQSSHLGGHRFAATALDLVPGGPVRMYGRLRAEDAEPLLDRLTRGSVWLERYRGRADLPSAAQLVEAEALRRGAEDPIAVELPSAARGVATWAGGRVEVALAEEAREGVKACGGPVERWSRWVVA